jgi:lipopolysaccharide export system permease protein
MKILDRYVSAELILPFLAGLAGFVLIEIGTVLFNQVIEVVLQSHARVSLVLLYLAYQLPQFVVFALPIAMLFGVSLGMNRLAREGEINAMRMAGVPLRRLLIPLLGVGLIVSILDYGIEQKIAPQCSEKAQTIIQKMLFQSTLPQVKADVFFHANNYWFYVSTVTKSGDNRFTMTQVMAYQLRIGNYPKLIVASKGETDANGQTWVLSDGQYIDINKNGEVGYAPFKRTTLRLNQSLEQFMVAQRTPEQMSASELAQMISQFSKANLSSRALVMFYQLKYSIPAGCLVVALVSMPFAIRFSRSGSFVGMLLSIILFFFYYNTYFLLRLLGSAEILSPYLAAWGHNVLFAAIGLVMLWREE